MAKLTATGVRNAGAATKSYKLADGGGLYLFVNTKGARYWRYDYRFAGARKTLALGVYPEVSLKDARERHAGAREMLANNLDPSAEKKLQKLRADVESNNTFAAVADEWRERHLAEKSQSYRVRSERILSQDLYPVIGFRPIKEITAVEVLSALRNVEERTIYMAHRARQLASLIFRYAIATGRAERDPTADLKGALEISCRVSFCAARGDCVAEYQTNQLACSVRHINRALFDIAQSRKYLDRSDFLDWPESNGGIEILREDTFATNSVALGLLCQMPFAPFIRYCLERVIGFRVST